MAVVEISAKALGLSENVRSVNAPLRARLGLVAPIADRPDIEIADTRMQGVNLRSSGPGKIAQLSQNIIPLNFSLGVWFFYKGSTRFHAGYEDVTALIGADKGSDTWVEKVFERTAAMQESLGYNISLQAHYPSEIGPQNVAKWVQMMEQTGIGVDSLVPMLFADEQFQFGSLTNPVKEVREVARQRQLETFQLASLLGVPGVNHWFGIDGYENVFGQSRTWAFDQITGATADAMNAVPGQQASEEPKPYEPRGINVMATTADGLEIARGVEEKLTGINRELLGAGYTMVGMCPEIGHMQMAYEILPLTFEGVLAQNRLFCIHWNGQPKGNYDIDENPGLFEAETLDQIALVLQRAGYKGVHALDINPLRMSLESACSIGFLNLAAAFSQAKAQDHQLIADAVANPDRDGNAALQLMQLIQRRPGTPEAAKAEAILAQILLGFRK